MNIVVIRLKEIIANTTRNVELDVGTDVVTDGRESSQHTFSNSMVSQFIREISENAQNWFNEYYSDKEKTEVVKIKEILTGPLTIEGFMNLKNIILKSLMLTS